MAFDAYRAMLDQVVAAVTGLATTGTNVFESPRAAIDAGKLPALAVMAKSVDAEILAEDPDGDEHLERHRFDVVVTTIGLSRDQRDTSSLEVKTAILVTVQPGELRYYLRSEFEEGREGEFDLWIVTQRFALTYHVYATAPAVLV